MPKIFISYRRADSADTVNRLYDRLVYAFGHENVFKDVDSLQRGDNFPEVLRAWATTCDVFLAVIGARWLSVQDEAGRRRIDDPNDWVRVETLYALKRDPAFPLIPTLVDDAALPKAEYLPDELASLVIHDAQVLSVSGFHDDVTALITSIRQRFGLIPQPTSVNLHNAHRDLVEMMRLRSWDAARDIVAAMRATGGVDAQFQLDRIEAVLYTRVTEEQRDRDYGTLRRNVELLDLGVLTQDDVSAALEAFWQDYPGEPLYDPDNIASFKPTSSITTAAPHPAQWLRKALVRRAGSLDLLSASSAWINIPGTLGKQWNDAPYKIAKYPVTNAQFRLFVDAGGYREHKWWTEAGWAQRERDNWNEPRYWNDRRWNGVEQPVVGVSWYEAVAFCLWLTSLTGENIMLPTEAQWQYAAQGDDERDYPWGSGWDCEKCNNSVSPCASSVTTPVRKYEGKSDSFFGVVDMAGNVWEWCLTDYDSGNADVSNYMKYRVLRGGSWNHNDEDGFRCGSRYRGTPEDGYGGRGFRLALS